MSSQTLLAEIAHRILNAALEAQVGIEVLIEAPPQVMTPTLRAKQVLLRFKREDANFANLQIKLAPHDPDHRLWLIKKDFIATHLEDC